MNGIGDDDDARGRSFDELFVGPSSRGREGDGAAGDRGPLPTVSLPTGGGALRSVAEAFEVNPATGAGSTSIPLPIPPGRPGMELSLALAYSTSAGNGPFGTGWTLSPPSIGRKTERGLPRYTDGDTYVLSGADDLVPVGPAPEAAEGERTDYAIERYRPRVERGYARIERWRDRASGEVHWRVTSKTNVVSIFGASAAARVEHEGRVLSWLLEEVRDDRGNVTRYDYAPEDGAGIDPSRPSERHRFVDGAYGATSQRYLKAIRYANRRPNAPGDWMFEVVLDYGDHDADDPRPEPRGTWAVRPDPFSSYRAGFEVRTLRRCARVLVFHHFPGEPGFGDEPELVRQVYLGYDAATHLSKLTSVTVEGVRRRDDGTIEREALPPIAFGYSGATLRHDVAVLDQAPSPLASFVDLEGDGLPGALHREDGAWHYRVNRGEADLAPPRRLPTQPSAGGAHAQLLDLAGDGELDLVQLGGPTSGYWTRTREGAWRSFVPLASVPNVDFSDPRVRFVDLDGDGHADVLIDEEHAFVWYRAEPRQGFVEGGRVPHALEERRGPRVLSTEANETVLLADMTGDGLSDLVRVRASSVCYWPNLGFGRFGAKVSMERAPRLAAEQDFDPARVRLGDLDGSGTADVVYLDAAGARIFLNESGNGFSAEQTIPSLPPPDAVSSLSIVDLLGTGTGCLVWSSAQPGVPTRYVDLLPEKPHLLVSQDNGLGLETRVRYAPSTRFFLEDRASGRPWLTKLPFPVHVVERVERHDTPRDARLVRTYRYRHGYFDPHEREVRGFGYVETRDAESFGGARGKGLFDVEADNEDERYRTAPSVTKQWFHTGAWLARMRLERGYAEEYFDDPLVAPLPDTPLPVGSRAASDERQMIRALAGTPLRTEVYAEDGSERAGVPYAVTEQNRRLRLLHPGVGERHAVVAVDPGETLAIHYERRRDDPRILHALTLEVDDFGQVRRSAQVAYPRREPSEHAREEQSRLWVSVSEADFVHVDGERDWYRVAVPYEARTWELRGLPETTATLLDAATVDAAHGSAAVVETFGAGLERRLVSRSQQRYAANDQSGPLPLGTIESMALSYEREELAWTDAELDELLPDVSDRAAVLRDEGGYVLRDGGVWRPTGRVAYDVAKFHLPQRVTDPFGAVTEVEHDDHALLVSASIDAVGNRADVMARDYRALAPSELRDPNGNRTAVRHDALGRPIAVAALSAGDSLDAPTIRITYELGVRPAYVRTDRREVHADPASRWQTQIAFSDGAGDVLLEKRSAEPGPAHVVRDGETVLDEADAPRWIASGRVVLDTKGNPVKQYEPYFVRSSDYEPETALLEIGVTPVLRYDPLGRLVEAELPDGTRTRVELDAWTRTEHDANDLALDSPWADRMRALADAETHPAPTLPRPSAHALAGAGKRSASPTVVHLDALGRDVVSVVDNRERDASGTLLGPPADPESAGTRLVTRMALDLAGNVVALVDPRGDRRLAAGVPLDRAACALQHFDRLGRRWRLDSVDAGTKLALLDAADAPARERTANGVLLTTRHDALRRPVEVRADGVAIRRFVYGESHPAAEAKNLRGRVFRVYDGAGVLTRERYDHHGNLEARTRRVPSAHESAGDVHQPLVYDALPRVAPDGSDPLADDTIDPSIEPALEPALREEIAHDALSRPVTETLHDGSVVRPRYNEAGLLEAIDLAMDGGSHNVIENIDYDARGQRTRVEYAAGAFVTTYRYDPLSFRLVTLRTVRASDGTALQHLAYTYDAVGNITSILDHAIQDRIPGHDLAVPHRFFDYDGLGQLIEATGRAIPRYSPDAGDDPRDPGGLRRYTERYSYDASGNLRERAFRVAAAPGLRRGFTQRFEVEAGQVPSRPDVHGNRLVASERTSHPASGSDDTIRVDYRSDGAGNLLTLGLGTELAWSPEHSLGSYSRTAVDAAYAYDAEGERVRKVVSTGAGTRRERVYFKYFERYRERRDDGAVLERTSLNVMNGKRRVLVVEREGTRPPRLRFQLCDHLDTVTMEVDENGAEISYEEHLPHGETALFLAFRDVARKRYRYTGKERDEESGLSYHSARYLAPWLGRWCSSDPAGYVDGPNLFAYAGGDPWGNTDPDGMQARSAPSRAQSDWVTLMLQGNRFVFAPTRRLTLEREGLRLQPYVPPGESGVTISVGYDVRGRTRAQVETEMRSTGASPAVTAAMAGGAGLQGSAARAYLRALGHLPSLTPDVAMRLFRDLAFPEKAEMARRRSTGTAWAHNAAQPVSEAHFDRLHPFVRELLTDLAYNSAVYSGARVQVITDAISGDADDAVRMLTELRSFVEGLPNNLQRPEGGRMRIEWIDARIADLQAAEGFSRTIRSLAAQSEAGLPYAPGARTRSRQP